MLAVTVLVLVACGAIALVGPHHRVVAGTAAFPACVRHVYGYTEQDAGMQALAAVQRRDRRVAQLTMVTKQQNYERFKQLYADDPELVKLVRPESLPAVVQVLLVAGTDPSRFIDDARAAFPGARYQAMPCPPAR